MRSFFALTFLLALSAPCYAGGPTHCDAELLPPEKLADRFYDAQKLDLPPSAVEATQAHEISRLTEMFHRGQGIAIGVGPELIQRGKFLGEYIQSAFVVKTLKQIFPDALIVHGDFTSGWMKAHPEKHYVHLQVTDTAESRLADDDVLDMPVLKAANPSLISLRKMDTRSVLGIPADKKTISLYVKKRSFNTPGFPNAAAVLQKALDVGHAPDIVFLTIGGTATIDVSNDLAIFAETLHYVTVYLSKLTQPLESEKKYIVLNDMTGKLPYLDRAANISVRIGPINIFESLAVGTPTIYFENSEVLGSYAPEAFSQMSVTAQKTGAAYPVKDIDHFSETLVKVLESPNSPLPPDPQSFDRYLTHLYELLKRKLLANKY